MRYVGFVLLRWGICFGLLAISFFILKFNQKLLHRDKLRALSQQTPEAIELWCEEHAQLLVVPTFLGGLVIPSCFAFMVVLGPFGVTAIFLVCCKAPYYRRMSEEDREDFKFMEFIASGYLGLCSLVCLLISVGETLTRVDLLDQIATKGINFGVSFMFIVTFVLLFLSVNKSR